MIGWYLAKRLQCERQGAAGCGKCSGCRQVERRVHPDIIVLESEGEEKEIGIRQVRQAISRMSMKAFSGPKKIIFIRRFSSYEAISSVQRIFSSNFP